VRRPSLIASILAGVVLFLVISALLARAFSVGGAEQSAIGDLLRAEARGDASAVEGLIAHCRTAPGCPARARAVAAGLRHPGAVSVIQIQGTPSFTLGSGGSLARVAWLAGSSLPRVQCVRVHHSGNIFAGFTITLRRVSRRIASDADCPRTF
jgi:hypothetical protein